MWGPETMLNVDFIAGRECQEGKFCAKKGKKCKFISDISQKNVASATSRNFGILSPDRCTDILLS